jgi:hypothetical protein
VPERWPAPQAPETKAASSWDSFKAAVPRKIAIGALGSAVGGAAPGATQQALTNVADDKPWSQGVLFSSLSTALSGAIFGVIGGGLGAANESFQLKSQLFSAVGKDPLGYAVGGGGFAAVGTAVVTGGFTIYNQVLNSYGSN